MESTYFDSNGEVSPKQKLKSTSAESPISSSDNGCFDCNICLESAHDPVVTLCGHLYCWPCIYKWLSVQSSSAEPDQQQTCPICKAEISHTSLVPLYGRGTSNSESESKKLQMGLGIPQRPPPYNLNAMLTSNRASNPHQGEQLYPSYFHSQSRPLHYQQHYLYGTHGANGLPYLGGAAMTSFFNPVIGMFGEMVLTRIFGVSDANLFPYPHSGSGSPRMRRQEMQIDKSLNRVSIFLLCCIILCLLLF
ncbi:E3 ubiquitin-protein ligase RMA3-like [Lotus japonicus]|uniref:E3 ubiquitin-protein ligase RMA3-like n=1 Tax=Lotus japonicus TaxID=34305 RepID=UPI00258954DB|nr:E3 ubiquitin-protein ligase RMA3-like [Lotus japonicus]